MSGDDEQSVILKAMQQRLELEIESASQCAANLERWLKEGNELNAEVLAFVRQSREHREEIVDAIREHRDAADFWKYGDDSDD